MPTPHESETLPQLAQLAQLRGVFGEVVLAGSRLECSAKSSPVPAQYRVELTDMGWNISLGTMDRWLSESIESQLVESRDSLEDLLNDELIDLDWKEGAVPVRHFRDDAKRYVFECTLGRGSDKADNLRRTSAFLFAFEAAFSQLGDMSEGTGSHAGREE